MRRTPLVIKMACVGGLVAALGAGVDAWLTPVAKPFFARADMSGENTDASGRVTAFVPGDKSTIALNASFTDVSGAQFLRFFDAEAGRTTDLPVGSDGRLDTLIKDPPAVLVDALHDGNSFAELHTDQGKSLSGLIALADTSWGDHSLKFSEGLPTSGNAAGTCEFAATKDGSAVGISCSHNLAGAQFGHIHRGTVGQNGPIVYDFSGQVANNPSGTLTFLDTNPPSNLVPDILADPSGFFLDIEVSAAGPAGRGQFPSFMNDQQTVGAFDDRFKYAVEARNAAGLTVSGSAGRVADGQSLFYFFASENWEMLVKMLDGCATNDHYWVFYAATTDVEYTLTVTDTTTSQTKTYFNALGNVGPAITDTAAFATCP